MVDNSTVSNGEYHVVDSNIPETHRGNQIQDDTQLHYTDSQSNSLTVPHYIGSKAQDSAPDSHETSALDSVPNQTGSSVLDNAPDYGGSNGSVHINGAEQLVS